MKELNFKFLSNGETVYLCQLYKLFPALERLNLVIYGNRIQEGSNCMSKMPPLKSLTIRMGPHAGALFSDLYRHLRHDKM